MTEIITEDDDEFDEVRVECGDYIKLSYGLSEGWYRIVNGFDRYAIVNVENGFFNDSINRSQTFEISIDQLVEETEHIVRKEVKAVVKSDDSQLRLSEIVEV